MRVIWLSANKLGYELLKEVVKLKIPARIDIVTLSAKAKIVIYDGVERSKWYGFGLPVFEVEDINKEERLVKRLRPDLIVICGWRQIVNKRLIDIPKMGVIGFHPTLLPEGRGPAPIINTILNEVTDSGLTMFYMTTGLDDGDIIAQERFIVRPTDDAGAIYKKIIRSGRKIIRAYFLLIIRGKAGRFPQDLSKASIFEKPNLRWNRIDPQRESLDTIYRKIKAFSKPYKGAYIEKGNRRLIIWKAEMKGVKK